MKTVAFVRDACHKVVILRAGCIADLVLDVFVKKSLQQVERRWSEVPILVSGGQPCRLLSTLAVFSWRLYV
ncbi:MAG: hypothetical protein VX471_04495 [Acidobacteriota bacterium]|mgnify:FL=1|nr:hypothetical protein [Acidobacteriota bacterium]